MTLNIVQALLFSVIQPTLSQLPPAMNSAKAIVLLIAIGLQESALTLRRQMGNGPARGLWQFEVGNAASRGGVTGLMMHPAARGHLEAWCKSHDVKFTAFAIWNALETNDIFACGVARLMLWTVGGPIPELNDVEGAWKYYVNCWNPGKPKKEKWVAYYARAMQAVNELEG